MKRNLTEAEKDAVTERLCIMLDSGVPIEQAEKYAFCYHGCKSDTEEMLNCSQVKPCPRLADIKA